MGVTGSHNPPPAGSNQPAIWMVLEDDFSLRSLLEEMIKMWGRRPLIFQDGFRASSWLDEAEAGKVAQLPEVALLDIRVPGPQGPEIAQRMRKTPATANIPIVIMTAYRVDSDEKREIMDQAQPDALSKGTRSSTC
jgi:CheY-like chemotaxis protein